MIYLIRQKNEVREDIDLEAFQCKCLLDGDRDNDW